MLKRRMPYVSPYPPPQYRLADKPIDVEVSTRMLGLFENMVRGEGTYNVLRPSDNPPRPNHIDPLLGFVTRVGLIRHFYQGSTTADIARAWIDRFDERFGDGLVPYTAPVGSAEYIARTRETLAIALRREYPRNTVLLPALVFQATIDYAADVAEWLGRPIGHVYRTAAHMYFAIYSKDAEHFFVPTLPL